MVAGRDDATTDGGALRAAAPGRPATPPAEFVETLARGNVVLVARPSIAPEVATLVEDLTGRPATRQDALLRAGQGIEMRETQDVAGVTAYAVRRELRASGPDSPDLLGFIEYWLGRGSG